MKRFQILAVDFIYNDKAGNPINLTRIQLANAPTPILRREKEFLQDLKNSRLIPQDVKSIQDFRVMDAVELIEDGTVIGDISFTKAGEMWTVTKDSRCITDSTHPLYNKVTVGQQLPAETDSTQVEGFLSLRKSMATRQLQANADALAKLQFNQMASMFGAPVAQPATDKPSVETPDKAPDAKKIVEVDNSLIDDYLNEGNEGNEEPKAEGTEPKEEVPEEEGKE